MPAVTTPSMASPIPARSLSSTMSPGPMSLMPALSSPRSANCLAKVPAWPAGTNTNRVSGLASRALQERREIGIGERHLDGLDDLPAGLREGVGEYRSRLGARRPVRLDYSNLLAAVL